MISPDSTKVTFIGVGVVGYAMAKNAILAGYDIVVHNRTKNKAEELVSLGATWAETVSEAVQDADVVFTMFEYPEDVENIYIGDGGIVENAPAGAYLIDMTTSSPRLARELYAMAAVNDLRVLDAPVMGGDIAADAGTLTFLVGGEATDFETLSPFFECIGKKIILVGGAGSGQYAKLANEIALAGSIMGAVEALAFAKQAGLDPKLMLSTMKQGPGTSFALQNFAPLILKKEYSSGFFVEEFIKDLGIALATADAMELTLPGLETAYQLYDLLTLVGGDGFGVQALALMYEDEDTCASFGLDWSRAEDVDDEDYEDYEDFLPGLRRHDRSDDDMDFGEIRNGRSNHRRPIGMRHDFGDSVLGSFFSQN
ncbi:MAG: NAD(P)-dependent oxidoreductase [Actinobacteria bacterium]|nr:NAD(P)-dependent oxidoreductase [Actinomycetota bacterium]